MNLEFREAHEADLPQLISMLADDAMGASRQDASTPVNPASVDAFQSICTDPNNELIVVSQNAQVVGMLQLTFIPYLSHIGAQRCLIESVRIARAFRGSGLGTQFFHWAISRAREHNCQLVQLTSDKQCPDAIRLYEGLGFVASHEGFKSKL